MDSESAASWTSIKYWIVQAVTAADPLVWSFQRDYFFSLYLENSASCTSPTPKNGTYAGRYRYSDPHLRVILRKFLKRYRETPTLSEINSGQSAPVIVICKSRLFLCLGNDLSLTVSSQMDQRNCSNIARRCNLSPRRPVDAIQEH